MSCISQKPDCKAKVGGRKIEKAPGSGVCFLFTAGGASTCPSCGEGASGSNGAGRSGVGEEAGQWCPERARSGTHMMA